MYLQQTPLPNYYYILYERRRDNSSIERRRESNGDTDAKKTESVGQRKIPSPQVRNNNHKICTVVAIGRHYMVVADVLPYPVSLQSSFHISISFLVFTVFTVCHVYVYYGYGIVQRLTISPYHKCRPIIIRVASRSVFNLSR